jgi:hypothetical protein
MALVLAACAKRPVTVVQHQAHAIERYEHALE